MVNRRGFIAGALGVLAIRPTFAEEAQRPAPQLQELHRLGPRNFYFNVANLAYDSVYKQPLASVTSYAEVDAVIVQHWDAYKAAMKGAVSAFIPQLAGDNATLKTLRTTSNFELIRHDDTRRYSEINIQNAFPKNVATNALYFRIRELAENGVITPAQGAAFVNNVDRSVFYTTDLPDFVSEQAIAALAVNEPGQQGLIPSPLN